jgi:hypothetical protein
VAVRESLHAVALGRERRLELHHRQGAVGDSESASRDLR